MPSMRARVLRGLVAFCAAFASAAVLQAWRGDEHVSIVLGAFRLSPAAERLIPSENRDAFFEAVDHPDPADPSCTTHRGPAARRDAAGEAAAAFTQLTRADADMRPYYRAKLLGRYLHFVADTSVPTPIATGKAAFLPDFFSNKDFIVFREPRALHGPLREEFAARGGEAQWAEDSLEAHPAILRAAINLTIEAILLLGPAGGAPSDLPLVIFLVNRIDNGAAMTHSEYYSSTHYTYVGPSVIESYEGGVRRVGGGGVLKPDLMNHAGVLVVELERRRLASGSTVRALLFNNQAFCAGKISLKMGGHVASLPNVRIPPQALRRVELELPAGVELVEVSALSGREDCGPASEPTDAVGTQRRLVLGLTGAAPRFEGPVSEWVAPAPAPTKKPRMVQ